MSESTLQEISALGADLEQTPDRELADRARTLREQALAGTPLPKLLPECFALVREAARRTLGERPYDVQMLAGIALHDGKLVEMSTGEGKTLAAVAPVALHALAGRGVHVLTFNDYLACRDAAWMGPVYERLGLSVGSVQEGLTTEQRRRAYGCDVTYVTAKEAGFDHLRDSLCLDPSGQVHRPFHLALVDEADSLLIDEARIPLVIAGNQDEEGIDPLRITLLTIDRFWSDHLAEMQAVRDEVHLVQVGGKDPFTEFCLTAAAAFDELLSRIDEAIVEIFERVEITAAGVDWDREGLGGPSSTWTYLVNDSVFGGNTFLTMANRASFGLWAVLLCWWILIPWALVLHWKRWRKRKEGGSEDLPARA